MATNKTASKKTTAKIPEGCYRTSTGTIRKIPLMEGKGKNAEPVYGGRNGTGIANPGKNRFGVKVEFYQGSGPRGRYNVKYKGSSIPVTEFMRVLGAKGYTWQEVDCFLADSGMPNISLNTLKSQVNSGYRSTLSAKELKDTSLDGKATNATHHGVPSEESFDIFGTKLLKEAKAYYAKRVAEMKAATKRPS